MMKKIMILLFLFSCSSWFACGEELEQLIKSNDFSCLLVNENGGYGGKITNNKGYGHIPMVHPMFLLLSVPIELKVILFTFHSCSY